VKPFQVAKMEKKYGGSIKEHNVNNRLTKISWADYNDEIR